MRFFYSLIFYSLVPIILLRLLWRSIKAPAYRLRWLERLGFYPQTYTQDVIWFHAVSVGEAEALFPLILELQKQRPAANILITTTTPTGSARVKAVLNDSVAHVYLPYDIPCAVNRFMHAFKPKVAVMMETEIWPNLFHACGNNRIPLTIFNARLSEKSARGYQKIPALIKPALANVELIAAQTQEDAERFMRIGAPEKNVAVLGNIKFDLDIPPAIIEEGSKLKADLFKDRFVWLIASTHKDEEALMLGLYPGLKEKIPELLLLFVPRHPERFQDVKKLCVQQSLSVVMRTENKAVDSNTDVYIADTMGELKMLYAATDITFVGGSMVPVGGHNILEALAVGVPVLFGPYMRNFKEIAQEVLKRNAALQCATLDEVSQAVLDLYTRPSYRAELIAKGKDFVIRNQGTKNKLYHRLEAALSKTVR